jgi:hypothetical protein
VKLSALAGYALAALGTGMAIAAVSKTFGNKPKYPIAKPFLIQLLRTDARRAQFLCRTAPGTFFEAIGAAINTGEMCGTTDPAIVTTATQPAYDAAGMMVVTNAKTLVGKAKMALMLTGGGLALGLSGGTTSILVIILLVLSLLALIWLMVHKSTLERSIVLARAEILPEVDRAFAEGRFAGPPPVLNADSLVR